jgi:RimJ/RimL family protein N-acetyltransferase
MRDIVITRLSPADSARLSKLLMSDDPVYGQYFLPFPINQESLEARLKATVNDRYWGLLFGDELVGFFMLRGFDEGYQRPSFGVYIARRFSRQGLSKLALEYSMNWCRLNGIHAMMLKVHPDNKYAGQGYEKAGFKFIEVCPRTGQNVMEKRWDEGE